MKIKWKDILKIFKGMLMVFAIVVCLSACSSEEGDQTAADMSGSQSELDEQQRSCWQASLLEMFYDAMAGASMKVYPKVTKSIMPFMMIVFAIWLSIRLLKHVSSVVEESPAEVWTEISKMAFICLFCGTLASSTNFLLFTLNKFIFPIYYTFLEFGSEILALTAKGEDADIPGQVIGSSCLFYTNSLVCKAKEISDAQLGQFPSEPSELMQCLVCATSDRMQLGFFLAKELLSMPSLTAMFVGLLLYLIFSIVKVSFVFYLVDSIFRMCIMVIILPFLIIAIPFKSTRGWTKEGLLTIFNSAAVMMCIAIIATMAMLAMQFLVNDNYENFGDKAAFSEFGILPAAILLIAFLILKSLGMAVGLAGSIVGGGGNTNFEKKIGKLAAWAAKKVLSIISSGSSNMITNVLDKFEKIRELRKKVQKMRKKRQEFMNRISGRNRGK